MAAGLGVGRQPVQQGVLGEVQRGDDQHRVASRGRVGCQTIAPPAFGRGDPHAPGVVQLAGVQDPHLAAGLEGTAVERVEDAVVGGRVRSAVRLRQRRILLHQPLAGHRVDHRDVGIGLDPGHQRPRGLELDSQPGEFGVHPAGLAAVRQDAAPVRLGAEVQGVPVPVLDHPRTARDEGPGGLPPLAVEGRPVLRSAADGLGVGLGDEEGLLAGGEDPVGALVQRPHAGGLPPLLVVVGGRVGQREGVLHVVVRVARGDVQGVGDLVVLHRGVVVGEAGGDELVGAGVLAGDAGLPGDELGGLARLERPPGDVVLRLLVVVGLPQVGPGGEPVRPVDQAPLPVEGLHVAVGVAQVVDEALEDAVVVRQAKAGLVVDLEADDGRVRGVPVEDRPGDAFGVVAEGGVGEVGLLAGAPAHALPRRPVADDLRVLPGQPRRDGVGGRAEDDRDAALVGSVEHRRQPVELEPAVLGLPGGPDGLADPDDGEPRLGHQVEVFLEPLVRLVLVVVGGAEQDARGQREHGCTSERDGAPAAGAAAGAEEGFGQEAVPVTVVPDLVTW